MSDTPSHDLASSGAPTEESTLGAAIPDAPPATDEAALESLRVELEAAQAGAAEHLASTMRITADFANYRRRTAEERERETATAAEALLRRLLPILDDLDRAFEQLPPELSKTSWVAGIAMIDHKLRALMEAENMTAIEAMGKFFNPKEHEALGSLPTEAAEGLVLAEAQRGYKLGDKILRPALVMVAAPLQTTPAPDIATAAETTLDENPGDATPNTEEQPNDTRRH